MRTYRFAADSTGQSLVELALALPVLLLLFLGLADFGRAFYYTSTIANAARVGAGYAAANASTATQATVAARVCNETGLTAYSPTPVCPGLTTAYTIGPNQEAVVDVTYDFQFVSAYLVNRVFHVSPLVLHAQATFPGLSN